MVNFFFFLGQNSLLKARNGKNKPERETHIRKKKMMMMIVEREREREREENLLYQFSKEKT